MGVREQLTEPWGILAAGLLGGLGGAVTAALAPAAVLGVPVGLTIAALVYGVRVGLGALADREPGPSRDASSTGLPVPPRGSVAAGWLRRAEVAVDNLDRLAGSSPDGILRVQVADVGARAGAALGDLRRFAGQVTLIERSMAGVDTERLHRERSGLRRGLAAAPAGPLREERERALRAVDDQLDVGRRLSEAREMLLARMQSAVLGLEGLLARLSELIALHAAADGGATLTAARVAELSGDLEGMRAGLAEAEELSRATMAARPPRP